jgi:hypothetical protein
MGQADSNSAIEALEKELAQKIKSSDVGHREIDSLLTRLALAAFVLMLPLTSCSDMKSLMKVSFSVPLEIQRLNLKKPLYGIYTRGSMADTGSFLLE